MTSSTAGTNSSSNVLPLEEALEAFPAASPEMAAGRELQQRVDIKYMIPGGALARLLPGWVKDYAILEAGIQRLARYQTMYYDTPALDLFHAHRRGLLPRLKVRTRHHLDRGVAYLEIKKKDGSLKTKKTRRPRDPGDVLLNDRDRALLRDFTPLADELGPVARTDFQRITLVGLEVAERITIDVDFRVATPGGHRVSFSRVAIVEVKQARLAHRTPVRNALRQEGFRPGGLSKYCAAIMVLHPETRGHALRPALRHLRRIENA